MAAGCAAVTGRVGGVLEEELATNLQRPAKAGNDTKRTLPLFAGDRRESRVWTACGGMLRWYDPPERGTRDRRSRQGGCADTPGATY